MSDKMDNEALHKFFNNINSTHSYPPPPYHSLYPPTMHSPMMPYPAPSEYLNSSMSNDKSKMGGLGSPYNDYYKNALYYPNYPPAAHNKNTTQKQRIPSSFPHPTHQKTNKQQAANQVPNNPMYPVGMQSNSPYHYGFPYYYPGMPYPFMYPSYYYNRSLSDMYPGQGNAGNYGMMAPPYFPPPPSLSSLHKNISPVIKQQIIISSDDQNHAGQLQAELPKRQAQYQMNRYNQYIEQKKEKEKRLQQQMKLALARQQQQLKQANDDNQIPFEIRRRKKIEKDRTRIKKEQLLQNKRQSLLQSKKKTLNNTIKAEQSREDTLKKIEVANYEKERLSGPLDSKQNASSQRNDLKKNKNNIQAVLQKDEKKQPAQDKQNQKKQRIKDDHPLKQLRYSESHGRIRIGNHYQSSVPSLLCDDQMLLLRKRLQEKLKQREISVITF